MFVGHSLLAFVVVALIARWKGWTQERALHLGLVAGAFGVAPDIDMLYASLGLFAGADSLLSRAENFWAASTVVHRTVTHSLVIASGMSLAAAAWSENETLSRSGGVALSGLLIGITYLVSGELAAVIMLVFAIVVLAIATVADRLDFGPRSILGAALFGLLSHPFGDLFTGTPPQFLYPLDRTLIGHRITLSSSPTIHLLSAAGIELALVWLAAIVFYSLTNRQLRDHIEPWAALAVGYGGAVLAIPPPTLDTSYPFVFSILGVGVMCAAPRLDPRRLDWLNAVMTAVTGITIAVLTYIVSYEILVT